MERTNKRFDDYLQQIPEQSRATIQTLNQIVVDIFGESERSIWEGTFWGGSEQTIIGYGDFKYKRSDKKQVEWFMVGVALQKNYYSYYINAIDGKQYLVKKYAGQLGKVRIGASSISFKKIEDLNIETMKEIIQIAYAQTLNT
ncbi:DUF1801 domain-containing protein [Cytobacillus horneckiae]|uniref:DUF1801 domain-containing protein n=1 Tax=Cytobacillus horneckiae TaxID=549687 RepID=UPI002041EC20|nr:DUF1801 domain-containing protein [Cytobacillus horneckiae]MCM3178100.1 DUF1801 domain-containing protein [Cytobacillus horneckiae]